MPAPTKVMTKTEMKTAIQTFIKAWNRHDVDKALERFTENVMWESPSSEGPLKGREAVAADLKELFTAFPDMHFPMEDFHVYLTDDPSTAFSTWTLIGTMTGPMSGFEPTGKPVRITGVCVYKFRGGLIAEHRIVFDTLDFVQQLGLLPREEEFSYKALMQLQRLATRTKRVLHV